MDRDRPEVRALAAAPGDPQALLAACRALAQLSEVRAALELLKTHAVARSSASSEELEKTLREMASADPSCAVECFFLLAREQLRFGDIEGSRRTLDEIPTAALEGALALRVRSLRASALFRIGDATAAEQELELARKEARSEQDLSLALSLAEYSVARCELRSARESLRQLAPETRLVPHLEARRTTALAMSYLFEERHERAAIFAKRARLAQRRVGVVDPLTVMIEVLALLGADAITRAAALSERYAPREEHREEHRGETLGRGIRILHRAATAWRRGDFLGCLAAAEPGFQELDRRADQVARAVVAHYLGRALLGLGELERAEEYFRYSKAIAADHGLALLSPMAEMDFALLAEAKGDRTSARAHVKRARRRLRRAPYVEIEAWALGEREAKPAIDSQAASAYASLREAERALELGMLDDAITAASRAERWYRRAGAHYELARSLLATAEAGARAALMRGGEQAFAPQARGPASVRREGEARRQRELTEANVALAECESIADAHRYAKIAASAALVRAYIADGTGALDAYTRAIARAIEAAGPALTDSALMRAAQRASVVADSRAHGDVRPFAALVARLALDRPAEVMLRIMLPTGEKIFLRASNEAHEGAILDLDRAELIAKGDRVALSPRSAALLELIARAGENGATAEALYLAAWSATDYHPLRHRNGVYVAINRLRASLKPLFGANAIVQSADGVYALGFELATKKSIDRRSKTE